MWIFIATVFIGISGLVLTTLIGSIYGAKQLGIYSQVIAIYTLVTVIATFGINTSTLKHIAENASNNNCLKLIYSGSFLLVLIVSLIISFVLLITSLYLGNIFSSQAVAVGVTFITPAIPLFSMNKNSEALFMGSRRMKLSSSVRISRWLIVIFLSLIIIYSGADFNYLFLSYLIAELVLGLYILLITRKYFTLKYSSWIKKHIIFGSKNIIATFMSDFNDKFNILLVGYLLSEEETGYFSYTLMMAKTLLLFASVIQQNFDPLFANLWKNGEEQKIKDMFNKIFRFSSITCIPLVLMGYCGYYFYTGYFMSADYLLMTNVIFIILIIGIGIFYLYSWAGSLLVMSGHLNANIFRLLIVICSNVILSYVLVNAYNLTGAAIAFSLMLIINLFVLLYIINKKTQLNLFQVTLLQIFGRKD